jgi:non-lysosomal glucosylceramidase
MARTRLLMTFALFLVPHISLADCVTIPVSGSAKFAALVFSGTAMNVAGFGGGEMGAVNGVRPDGSVDHSSEQSAEVWVGTTYALAAFMLGRGLDDEAWQTARGAWNVTWNRGLWFRTPEAYDADGNFRASLYLRPLAIWAIEDALARRTAIRS